MIENRQENINQYAALRLENQICFPLYACAKEIVRKYKPYLDKLDLTYTQYIAMMVLWEKKEVTVKELGAELFLDSGTLTPLLKKLETKGYIVRKRMESDERNLCITITEKGEALKEEAVKVPEKMRSCIHMEEEAAKKLHEILHQMLQEYKIRDATRI